MNLIKGCPWCEFLGSIKDQRQGNSDVVYMPIYYNQKWTILVIDDTTIYRIQIEVDYIIFAPRIGNTCRDTTTDMNHGAAGR